MSMCIHTALTRDSYLHIQNKNVDKGLGQLAKTIRIHLECEGGIENSCTRDKDI